jgi:hypothetical protein
MDLAQLIMCYDGSKKLGMEKAAAKLEKLIYKVSSKMLRDFVEKDTDNEKDTAEEVA